MDYGLEIKLPQENFLTACGGFTVCCSKCILIEPTIPFYHSRFLAFSGFLLAYLHILRRYANQYPYSKVSGDLAEICCR